MIRNRLELKPKHGLRVSPRYQIDCGPGQIIIACTKHAQKSTKQPYSPFSRCSSLVKSTLLVGLVGVSTAPSLNWMKLRSAVAAAWMRAVFLLRPSPLYFWPSTWKAHRKQHKHQNQKPEWRIAF